MNYTDMFISNVINFLNPTWPQAALVIFIIFIWKFKVNISHLIGRIQRLSKEGLTFHVPQLQRISEDINGKNDLPNSELITIRSFEAGIRSQIAALNEQDKIPHLIKVLAITSFYSKCQAIYNIIFGRQINLLRIINTIRMDGMTLGQMESYFKQIQVSQPNTFEKWTVQMYFNFLLQSQLIIEQNGRFKITDFGVDFLTWLPQQGLPENKAL